MSSLMGSRTCPVLQWALPAVLLFVGAVTGADFTGTVTATPSVAEANSWVQLECEFNLTEAEATYVYWSDNKGDTLYAYQMNITKLITYGPHYKDSTTRGYLKDLNVSTGYQSVMLYVHTCNYSPYTCYIWKEATELVKPLQITVKYLPEPTVTRGDVEVTELTVQHQGMYTFACKVSNATAAHNLTINTTINGTTPHQPQQEMGINNNESCTFSSEANQTYDLKGMEVVIVRCNVAYDSGETFTRTVTGQQTTTEEVMSTTGATGSSTTQEANTTIDATTDDAARLKLPTWIITALTVACVAIIACCVATIVVIKKLGTAKQLARAAGLKQQQPPRPGGLYSNYPASQLHRPRLQYLNLQPHSLAQQFRGMQ